MYNVPAWERPRAGLAPVTAASTLQPQRELKVFISSLRQYLGDAINLRRSEGLHFTVTEPQPLRRTFLDYGYQPNDVIQFWKQYKRFLKNMGHDAPIDAALDVKMPLMWIGGQGRLALNLEGHDQLQTRRADAEKFMRTQFGIVPAFKLFNPHITLGTVHMEALPKTLRRDARLNANELLPPESVVPGAVMLNGLKAYVGKINSSQPPID